MNVVGFILNYVCMTWILRVTCAPADRDIRFKGVPKPFTLSPRTKQGWRVPVASFGRDKQLPEVLEYSLTIEGRDSIDMRLIRDRRVGAGTRGIPAARRSLDIDNQLQGEQGTGFYTDANGHGSYACRVRRDKGDYVCDIYGLVSFEDETCYIVPGSELADCSTGTEGLVEYFTEKTEGDKANAPSRTEPGATRKLRRQRRQGAGPSFHLPDPGHRTVELAFVLDEMFMNTFYRRNPTNIYLAQQNAEMLITLTTIEMNVFFSSLKGASGGSLDMYVHASAIVYPPYGDNNNWSTAYSDGEFLYRSTEMLADLATNYDIAVVCSTYTYGDNYNWSTAYSDGEFLYRSPAMISDLENYAASGFTDNNFDHVMFITGFDYHNGQSHNGKFYLGFAFLGTVCTTSRKQFSFLEFDASQMTYIAVHELGHALGSPHDPASCQNEKYVMGAYMPSPSPRVLASTWQFSPCSADAIQTHLNKYPDCTANGAFTDEEFVSSFCAGMLGQMLGSLDLQCQRLTGWEGSTACTGVNAFTCSRGYQVKCMTSWGTCNERLPTVWNGTPCGTNKICFKGQCVAKFDVCPAT